MTLLRSAFLVSFACASLVPLPAAHAAEVKGKPEYPLAIFAFASGERMQERARQFAVASGQPEQADKVLLALTMELAPLLNSDGFDMTRPVGLMTFTPNAEDTEQALADLKDVHLVELSDPEDLLDLLYDEPVVFFPVRDATKFLQTFEKVADEKYIPTPDQPGHFQDEKGNVQPLRIVGRYVVYFGDERPDRTLPDLDELLRPLVVNRDAVLSIRARGIPKLLREAGGELLKMKVAASLQRFDDESDLDFRWRTALGAFQQELIEIAVSQIDEINLGVKFDPIKSTATIDLDLVGPRNGKLAKLCSALTVKNGFFPVLAEEPDLEMTLSTPINQKLAMPLIEAFRTPLNGSGFWTDQRELADAVGGILQSLASTLEAGHLDLRLTSHRSEDQTEYLVGMRVSRGNQLAQALPVALAQIAHLAGAEYGEESVEKTPVFRTTLGPFANLFDEWDAPPNANHTLWIAVGRQTLWLSWKTSISPDLPDALRNVLSSPTTPVVRPRFPLLARLHARSWFATSADQVTDGGDVQKAVAKSEDSDEEKLANQLDQVVQVSFRERPDGLQLDVRPTDTGLKLKVSCEEALITWFAVNLMKLGLSD